MQNAADGIVNVMLNADNNWKVLQQIQVLLFWTFQLLLL